ncbi:AAA family ATPase [Mucilaginibacter rubeus]|nr:AAA family ATPase [Mucilaginibacter rubeus]
MLFAAIYNFALEKKIIKRYQKLKYAGNLRVEIFYQADDHVYCLHTISENGDKDGFTEFSASKLYRFIRSDKNRFVFDREIKLNSKIIHDHFFYTIAVNYSIYGLNSDEMGEWIDPLFHKNDGYQTPVVINPFRDRGNINITVEKELVKQRLLTNILEPIKEHTKPEDSLRSLANGKTAKWLKLKVNEPKLEKYSKQNRYSVDVDDEVLGKLLKEYTGYDLRNVETEPELQATKIYIGYKLVRMCRNYSRYRRFLKDQKLQDVDDFIAKIIKDRSHVTFKIKQALNFLRYKLYVKNGTKNKDRLLIDEFSNYIKQIVDEERPEGKRNLQTIELIPPSIFDIEIMFDEIHSFNDLSSGEKQKIHSISSVVYHLLNLNSVFKSGADKNEKDRQNVYESVNIIFDEIELYFHPDLQRTFIKDLIEYIGKINPEHIDQIKGINILFSTHSPFILSDIPGNNVLYLRSPQDANGKAKTHSQTFGANIHDLLAHEFYMQQGFMGEWAKEKIRSVINFLEKFAKNQLLKQTYSDPFWNKDNIKEFINLIGEPIIRKSMLDLYFEAFGLDEIDREIERLTRLKKK